VPVSLKGLQAGGRWGKLVAVNYTSELGTWPIKFYANAFADAMSPDVSVIHIDEKVFAAFLKREGARHDYWTLRFWDIDPKKEWSRAITAGKEVPDVWSEIVNPMRAARRGTTWAGAEFTHPKLGSRVMVHRWPTAAIAPYGHGGSKYDEIRDRFVSLLRKII